MQILRTERNSIEALLKMEQDGELSEDCLTLDIYRPRRRQSNTGILVWIHGGGFINGASKQYDGIEQAKAGYIVVVIQYRLARRSQKLESLKI